MKDYVNKKKRILQWGNVLKNYTKVNNDNWKMKCLSKQEFDQLDREIKPCWKCLSTRKITN